MTNRMKKWSAIFTAIVLCFAFTACTDKAEENTAPESDMSVPRGITVTVNATCEDALADYEVPFEDGVVIPATTVTLEEGDTAYTALVKICELEVIDLLVSGESTMAYVRGIGGLSEMDCGNESGWTYTVNGEMAAVGAGDYVLQDGDILEWRYFVSYSVFEYEEAA